MRGLPQSKLALEWREWLTRRLTDDYFRDRSFYQIQAGTLVDNPDQRISSDIRCAHMCSREVVRRVSIPLRVFMTLVATMGTSVFQCRRAQQQSVGSSAEHRMFDHAAADSSRRRRWA